MAGPAGSELPRPGEVAYDRAAIARRVSELGREVSARYAGGPVPVLVTVLKGASIFATDLSRALTIDHELDFLSISAYGEQDAGRQARVLKDLTLPVQGRPVVLVEDVVDTGLTLGYLLRLLAAHDPTDVQVCTLLDRPHRRLVDVPIAWRGFTVPDRFLVGYGFDYRQRFRNLPDLHELQLEAAGGFEAAVREQLLGE